MFKIKHFIRQSWLLITASFFFGLLIAVTSAALSPRIEQNKINKRNQLVSTLLPEAKNFVPLDFEISIKSLQGQIETIEVFRAESAEGKCAGWSFNAVGPGFADKIELVVAVDKNFNNLAGFDVLSSNETPGFGNQIKFDYFRNQFKGAPAANLKLETSGDNTKIDSEIIAISGATISSEAVVNIISNTVTQIKEQIQEKGLIGNDK
ncbi:MAG: FMN-binding protein [Sedimentisphaerales bacterium]|nr:FMN-binding protein [Sedimentisphaerales bacterium]